MYIYFLFRYPGLKPPMPVCNVYVLFRYPGLKPPMVGGIDLVGKVIETKSDSLKVRVSIR